MIIVSKAVQLDLFKILLQKNVYAKMVNIGLKMIKLVIGNAQKDTLKDLI